MVRSWTFLICRLVDDVRQAAPTIRKGHGARSAVRGRSSAESVEVVAEGVEHARIWERSSFAGHSLMLGQRVSVRPNLRTGARPGTTTATVIAVGRRVTSTSCVAPSSAWSTLVLLPRGAASRRSAYSVAHG